MKINLSANVAKRLQALLGGIQYKFLAFTVNFESGEIEDNLAKSGAKLNDWTIEVLSRLLTHYSSATFTSLSGKLVKYKDLPGATRTKEHSLKRRFSPLQMSSAETPQELLEAAAKLGGKPLSYGDSSAEIDGLKGVALVFIVWEKDEYPAAASTLYDQTASKYLPTEDLAVLGEVAASRLIQVRKS